MPPRAPWRAPRPAITKAMLYRRAVPALLFSLAAVTVILLLLAGGVLLGIVPYPGK